MAGKKVNEQDRIIELLEKMLTFQLHSLSVPQPRIARIVGKGNSWVSALLKGVQKGGKGNAE
jgi:hypothetical protein